MLQAAMIQAIYDKTPRTIQELSRTRPSFDNFSPHSRRSNFLLLGKRKFCYVSTKSGHSAPSRVSLILSFLHTALSKIHFNIITPNTLRKLSNINVCIFHSLSASNADAIPSMKKIMNSSF
jgi:hypothetical protein